jgi:hypothetical protein
MPAGVLPPDRNHAGEVALFAGPRILSAAHESVAGAIENITSPNAHPDDPFAVDRRYWESIRPASH